jgi:hypothetical protein
MTVLTTCYGADIEAVADVDGGPRDLSSDAVAEFVLRQWNDVAKTLGFLYPLTTVTRGLRANVSGLTGLQSAALATFEQWVRARPRELSPEIPESVRTGRAQVRQELLLGYAAKRPDFIWYLEEAASSLPGGGCYARGPVTTVSGRAFADDNAPGYFHDGARGVPAGACGWAGPVVLSIGTFPWTYGSRLYRRPPGLDWDSSGKWAPAVAAMSLCASLWQPEGNLRQDARLVVTSYRRFQRHANDALRGVPVYDVRTAVPGMLYRRGLLLHAEQGSLENHTVRGARGPLAANAYNYCIRRFAAFFALRRSLLTGSQDLTTDQWRALSTNTDPCVQPFLKLVAQASP